jgi:hypothetical protein
MACTKMVKYPFEFIILKMFIAKIFAKTKIFAKILLISASRENGKKHFRFNPSTSTSHSLQWANFILQSLWYKILSA